MFKTRGPFGHLLMILAFGWLLSQMNTYQPEDLGLLIDQAEASEQWPSVEGVITRSGVATSYSNTFLGHRKPSHHPTLEFHYQVNGQRFFANYPWFGSELHYATRRTSKARYHHGQLLSSYISSHYPVKKNVRVSYNPSNPQQAVLEVGVPDELSNSYYGKLIAFWFSVVAIGFSAFQLLRWILSLTNANQPVARSGSSWANRSR